MKLAGKVALITGAASGIGRATALLFAREGARLVCADFSDADGRDTVNAVRASGGEGLHVHVDVRQMDDLVAAVCRAEETYGRLDIVVANAGTVGGDAVARPMVDLTEQQWASIIDVNLNGVFRTFRSALPALRRSGGGAMTATASIAALSGVAGQSAYTASKGGIVSLVRALAFELALDGIRVNSVCPGGVTTNLLRDTDLVPLLAQERRRSDAPPGTPSADAMAAMNRSASPEDIAAAHLFLVSPDSAMINGHALVVDGGSVVANRWLIVPRD